MFILGSSTTGFECTLGISHQKAGKCLFAISAHALHKGPTKVLCDKTNREIGTLNPIMDKAKWDDSTPPKLQMADQQHIKMSDNIDAMWFQATNATFQPKFLEYEIKGIGDSAAICNSENKFLFYSSRHQSGCRKIDEIEADDKGRIICKNFLVEKGESGGPLFFIQNKEIFVVGTLMARRTFEPTTAVFGFANLTMELILKSQS